MKALCSTSVFSPHPLYLESLFWSHERECRRVMLVLEEPRSRAVAGAQHRGLCPPGLHTGPGIHRCHQLCGAVVQACQLQRAADGIETRVLLKAFMASHSVWRRQAKAMRKSNVVVTRPSGAQHKEATCSGTQEPELCNHLLDLGLRVSLGPDVGPERRGSEPTTLSLATSVHSLLGREDSSQIQALVSMSQSSHSISLILLH